MFSDYGIIGGIENVLPRLLIPLDSNFIEKCELKKENVIEKWCNKKYNFIQNT